jgi:hypothetical protein
VGRRGLTGSRGDSYDEEGFLVGIWVQTWAPAAA